MNRDPMDALGTFYQEQRTAPSRDFEAKVEGLLDAECQELDFIPVVTGMRRVLPLAAALVFGVLSPSVSKSDVQKLADQIGQAQVGMASSVRTEPETTWQESISD